MKLQPGLHFDMRPKALIDELGLLAPRYHATSAYGHFGRPEFSWEKVNRAAVMTSDLLGGKVKGTEIVRKVSANGTINGSNGNGSSTNGNGAHASGKKAAKPSKKAGKKDKRSAAEA